MMGRVVAFRSSLVFGALTLAMAVSGLMAEVLPAGVVIAIFGFVTLGAGIVAAFLPADPPLVGRRALVPGGRAADGARADPPTCARSRGSAYYGGFPVRPSRDPSPAAADLKRRRSSPMTDPQRPDDSARTDDTAPDALTPEELAAAENAALSEAIDETEPDGQADGQTATETAGEPTETADAGAEAEPEPS